MNFQKKWICKQKELIRVEFVFLFREKPVFRKFSHTPAVPPNGSMVFLDDVLTKDEWMKIDSHISELADVWGSDELTEIESTILRKDKDGFYFQLNMECSE